MARLRTLERALGKLFKGPAPKQQDKQRKPREEAKRLAAEHGIEIEKLPGGGMNVWAPARIAADDPFEGDHYANDWQEALVTVQTYADKLQAASA